MKERREIEDKSGLLLFVGGIFAFLLVGVLLYLGLQPVLERETLLLRTSESLSSYLFERVLDAPLLFIGLTLSILGVLLLFVGGIRTASQKKGRRQARAPRKRYLQIGKRLGEVGDHREAISLQPTTALKAPINEDATDP